jgi:hypothetical protein
MFQQVANQSLGYNMNIKISHMVCHSLPSTWKEFANNYNFNAKSCLFLTKCKFIRWTWMTMNLLRKYDSHVYSKAHQIRNCNTCKPSSLPFCFSSELERTFKYKARSGLANDFLTIYLYFPTIQFVQCRFCVLP